MTALPQPIRLVPEVPWDAPIRLCLRDFLEPGECAIDVGAHRGELTEAMAAMVGPAGEIHALEPHPQVFRQLAERFGQRGNIHLLRQAAWSRSGDRLALHCDTAPEACASSLVGRPAACCDVETETVALDDYCLATGCRPKAVKIHVGGGEYQILEGARATLERIRPVVALRYVAEEDGGADAAALLESLGYWLFDATRYELVTREQLLPAAGSPSAVSLLAVHTGMDYSPYTELALRVKSVVRLTPTSWETEYVPLPSGRYIASFEVEAPAGVAASMEIDADDNRRLAAFCGAMHALKRRISSDLVFELSAPTRIRCRVGTDSRTGLHLRQVEIKQVRL